jgi:hypothetical protein
VKILLPYGFPLLGMKLAAHREAHYNLTDFSWVYIYMTYFPKFKFCSTDGSSDIVTTLKYSDYSFVLLSIDLVFLFCLLIDFKLVYLPFRSLRALSEFVLLIFLLPPVHTLL